MRNFIFISTLLVAFFGTGCSRDSSNAQAQQATQPSGPQASGQQAQPSSQDPPEGMSVAIFAGGCFWCMEAPFEELEGVSEVVSGYTGGSEVNPTYQQVGSGRTGHTEAVRVYYDPNEISYERLLEVFWHSMDPTDANGQFADRGSQYRPAIFYVNDAQKDAAEASKRELDENGPFNEPIVVPIQPATAFYVAEAYHQNYYRTNTAHYTRYKRLSGRTGFIESTWGDHDHDHDHEH